MGRRGALLKLGIGIFLIVVVITTFGTIHRLRTEDLEPLTVLMTQPRETTLMLVGLLLVLSGAILGTKGKDEWHHTYDPDNMSQRPYLPGSDRDARYILREAFEAKVKIREGLTQDELDGLSRKELGARANDPELVAILYDDLLPLERSEVNDIRTRIGRI